MGAALTLREIQVAFAQYVDIDDYINEISEPPNKMLATIDIKLIIEQAPPHLQTALNLILMGQTLNEIAQALHMSINTLKFQLKKFKQTIRQ